MLEAIKIKKSSDPWSEERWSEIEQDMRRQALAAESEGAAWEVIVRRARLVMRTYSTSFFIVTRFLPPVKRAKVESIYAAVRYPDEIVDSFPLSQNERLRKLDAWAANYETALDAGSIKEALSRGAPSFIAGFAKVVREDDIPREHYRAFIDAMRFDARPRRFTTLDDLIESYIYGSAIVVGYFLAHVYGPNHKDNMNRALRSARNLGIGLQLTNFLRDVGEDQLRGRLYLPLDMLAEESLNEIDEIDVTDPHQHVSLNRVLRRLTAITEDYYARALEDIDAFAPDCQIAIRACIDVYRQLNNRIGRSPKGILHRESVPITEKFRVLPVSKYWRLPLAYLSSDQWLDYRKQRAQ